jgi:two-component system NtrC family sensor kinase
VREPKGIPNTLAGKLTLAIFVLMIAISGSSGMLFFSFERNLTMKNMDRYARFMDELLQKSLYHDMLDNRRDDLEKSINSLGNSPDIEKIDIFDIDGKVVFSSGDKTRATDPESMRSIEKIISGDTVDPVRIKDPSGKHLLNFYSPINSAPACSTALCHYHPPEQEVLGVLFTGYDVSTITKTTRNILVGALLTGAFMVGLISLFLFYIIHKFVTTPVALLEEGMRRLSDGDFEHPIKLHSRDEMGRLAMNFNAMANDIQLYKNRLENWASELEAEVDKKTAEIKETQEQLANAEKLASLGRMSAGVAHELNNPLTGIVTFAHLMYDRTPPENKLDREDLELIIEQADRCTKIIKGLLSFSRKGASEKTLININDLIENAVSLIKNQSAFHNIKVIRSLNPAIPKIVVDTNQIQQVILNLITNSADAMNGEGEINITTGTLEIDGEQFIEAVFSDTGPGIMPEHMNKILEPFFTTKSVGKGTGLGLPVSYGIIKRHGGELLISSKVGKGATVTVRFPTKATEADVSKEGARVEFQ